MGATPARIGFVMQGVRAAVAETPDIATRHGELARRDDEPLETFFDNVADAQVMAEARQDLFGTERRRFENAVKGLDEALALPVAGPDLPEAHCVDELRSVDLDVLVAEVGFDFAAQKSTLAVWG